MPFVPALEQCIRDLGQQVVDTAPIWADHCESPTAKTGFQARLLTSAGGSLLPPVLSVQAIELNATERYVAGFSELNPGLHLTAACFEHPPPGGLKWGV